MLREQVEQSETCDFRLKTEVIINYSIITSQYLKRKLEE